MILTARQQSVLDFIKFFQQKKGISPSVREICSHLNLKGHSGVHRILHRLIELGYLETDSGKKRSWRLVGGPVYKTIPVIGRIAAGPPIEAVDNLEEELPIDPAMFGNEQCFALLVQGDSMVEAHILDGDLAIILPQEHAEQGEIVAVMVADVFPEATLKIFKEKDDSIELHAANSLYAPLIFEHEDRKRIRIVGKFAGVVRRARLVIP